MITSVQTHSRNEFYAFLLILLITVLVYMPGLNGGFLYDDYINIVNNPLVHPESLTPENLLQASGSFTPGGRHLSMLSFALNSYFLGPSAYGFKLVNLAIHLINGILIFFLTRVLLKACNERPGQQVLPAWLPTIVSAAWLLNPMELTTVLYVVQRMTGLSAMFVLTGLLMYTIGRFRQLQSQPGMLLILTGLIGCTTLAFLNKENGVLLFPFALLIELAFFKFRNSSGTIDRSILTLLVIFPALAAITLMITSYSPERVIAGYTNRSFTLEQRLMTEARVLWLYLRLILFPRNSMLGVWHDDIPVSTTLDLPSTTLPAILGIITLFAAGLLLLRRAPLMGFGILWFFIAHSLESSIISLEIAHEHRNYLASYGVVLTLFSVIAVLFTRIEKPWLGLAVAITTIIAFTLVTFERSQVWSNPLQHMLIEAANHPNSAKAQYDAGRQLFLLSADDKNAFPAGIAYTETAAELDRTGFIADLSLVTITSRRGMPSNPVWLKNVKSKIRQYPLSGSDISALRQLLECQQSKECNIPHDQADEVFRLAAQQGNLQAITLLGFYEANVLGRIEPARAAFKRAVEQSPSDPSYRVNYASFLAAVGEYENASAQLEFARKLDTFQVYKSQINVINAVSSK